MPNSSWDDLLSSLPPMDLSTRFEEIGICGYRDSEKSVDYYWPRILTEEECLCVARENAPASLRSHVLFYAKCTARYIAKLTDLYIEEWLRGFPEHVEHRREELARYLQEAPTVPEPIVHVSDTWIEYHVGDVCNMNEWGAEAWWLRCVATRSVDEYYWGEDEGRTKYISYWTPTEQPEQLQGSSEADV